MLGKYKDVEIIVRVLKPSYLKIDQQNLFLCFKLSRSQPWRCRPETPAFRSGCREIRSSRLDSHIVSWRTTWATWDFVFLWEITIKGWKTQNTKEGNFLVKKITARQRLAGWKGSEDLIWPDSQSVSSWDYSNLIAQKPSDVFSLKVVPFYNNKPEKKVLSSLGKHRRPWRGWEVKAVDLKAQKTKCKPWR